ncbi:swi5-dependent recombination DNA repair protein 1 homolog isoform X2 [Dreissena polymorpha]|uniref:swi5-dependent recombination DNA repair protein 1 homolog isoform X2 n=1 Tax=Dreissena polymorpha TaxID=45954 RepID=UPI00226567A7|nr:swi5-dependent recombination DNA repair protein 1 homolog isoform X2 [Dreissena polymorpha]
MLYYDRNSKLDRWLQYSTMLQPNLLSSSLKDRLKKCGRFHSSPYQPPEARQQTNTTLSSNHNLLTNLNESVLTDKSTHTEKCGSTDHDSINKEDAGKYGTLKFANDMTHSDVNTNISSGGLKFSAEISSHGNLQGDASDSVTPVATFRTPVNVRSRSSIKVKGNRLTFTDTQEANAGVSKSETSPDDCDKGREKNCDLEENSAVSSDVKPLEQCGLSAPVICSIEELERQIAEKEESLRKLNMVKMYRAKNNLEDLQSLIDKWRGVSQQSVTDLHASMTDEPRPSLTRLIDHLGIDHDLLKFRTDDDNESFY